MTRANALPAPLTARPATDADADLFRTLRASVPEASQPSEAAHAAWWAWAAERRWVAEAGGAPVGVLRLGADGTVSIVLAPGARGRGWGAALLRWLAGEARAAGVPRLRAEIAPGNAASRRAFLAAGYALTDRDRGPGRRVVAERAP